MWKCETVSSGRRLVLKLFHGPLGNYAQFPPEEAFAQDIYYFGEARNKYRPLAKRYDLRASPVGPAFRESSAYAMAAALQGSILPYCFGIFKVSDRDTSTLR